MAMGEQVVGSCKTLISVSLPVTLWAPSSTFLGRALGNRRIFFFFLITSSYALMFLKINTALLLASAQGTVKLYKGAKLHITMYRA